MGFSGSFVLARSAPGGIGWVGEPLTATTYADSWTSASYDGEDAFWDRDRTLRRLVEETQSPALVGLCLDSDFLGVVGVSPDGATWNGVVYRDAAEEYREEGLEEEYDEVVPSFAPPDTAVAGALVWASHAGGLADEDALRRILTTSEWVQPADAFWEELVNALGVPAG
ncbi:hypothetical protein GCM10009798_13720 [Nocardioides panacihumi]|uniref:Uncharacterized protein n=1 Tax=Nocardioides panacihumi TaxID=400774 RepID=A0ABP5C1C6_9ACTN